MLFLIFPQKCVLQPNVFHLNICSGFNLTGRLMLSGIYTVNLNTCKCISQEPYIINMRLIHGYLPLFQWPGQHFPTVKPFSVYRKIRFQSKTYFLLRRIIPLNTLSSIQTRLWNCIRYNTTLFISMHNKQNRIWNTKFFPCFQVHQMPRCKTCYLNFLFCVTGESFRMYSSGFSKTCFTPNMH